MPAGGTSRRSSEKDRRPRIYIATRNEHKLIEIRHILDPYGIEAIMVNVPKLEVQSDRLDEIALTAAIMAADALGEPVVVEDAGLFIEALGGFPGPYSAYVFKTIGIQGVLKLMEGVEDRRARFVSAVAYAEPRGEARVFVGVAEGRISEAPRGSGGFGFDPIFIPSEGDGRTFAEMSLEEKCRLSHRGKAFRALARWLCERGERT